jgi:glycosyltransferase involved in cell wall biosynthesis
LVDISVLTPSFGYGRFIEDAILSVRRQEGLAVQHVVQDGGSSDGTLQVLSRHESYVDWVSEPDEGQSYALNRALSRATGRWVAWLNADEFYLPRGLARLVEAGERSTSDVVYGDCVFVDEKGCVQRLLSPYRFSARVLRSYGSLISSCCVIFRRSALGEDPWDVRVRRVMDWDLYLSLLSRDARFLHTPYPVGAFRVHADQVTAVPWQTWQEEDESMAARYGRPTGLSERWRSYKRGRWLHRVHKVLGGSYLREVRARALYGADLRWFDSEVGYANWNRLLARCYG